MDTRLHFEVTKKDLNCDARTGVLTTRRGAIPTPVFMPVGSAGSVKACDPEELKALGFGLILGNTYHLMLRPGPEIIAEQGGLHRFMAWDGSILTDSGGYQVFSLAELRTISEQGVEFRSHLDGSLQHLSPERAIAIQEALGSDIMMVLDECPPHDVALSYLEDSMRRTTRWAKRCLDARSLQAGALFGIVQGGLDINLRLRHLEEIAALPFEGLAIGGLSVGEDPAATADMIAALAPRMPQDRPRYLMGMGKPADIIRAVQAGVDLFDCVIPTRNARNGQLFTWRGPLQIRNQKHAREREPIDPDCGCPTCQRFSRSYLRHLFMANEMLGLRLNTLHNLFFYAELMRRIQNAIEKGDYNAWAEMALRQLEEKNI